MAQTPAFTAIQGTKVRWKNQLKAGKRPEAPGTAQSMEDTTCIHSMRYGND
jgi:hypothetical protein